MSAAARLPAGNKSGPFTVDSPSSASERLAPPIRHSSRSVKTARRRLAAAQSLWQTHSQINTAARNLKHVQVCLGWTVFFEVGEVRERWGWLGFRTRGLFLKTRCENHGLLSEKKKYLCTFIWQFARFWARLHTFCWCSVRSTCRSASRASPLCRLRW